MLERIKINSNGRKTYLVDHIEGSSGERNYYWGLFSKG
jgi:hypothetical protein